MNTFVLKCLVPATLAGMTLLPMAAQADSLRDRQHDQRQRIEQGVDSGQLTRREQGRLNAREARVRYQEHRDRRMDDGHLTAGERRHFQHVYNQDSRAIYRDKHNEAERHHDHDRDH